MQEQSPNELAKVYLDTYKDVSNRFHEEFAGKAGDVAIAFHVKPATRGKFSLPAHTYANLYVMALATSQPPDVLQHIMDGWKAEVARQEKTLDWAQVEQDAIDVCVNVLKLDPAIFDTKPI